MLRVGLTGSLGSGKSTVAAMLSALGAEVISSDDLGRRLMQPGEAVFDQIVARFGPAILSPEGALDRRALASLAFTDDRIDELNAIIHPAVIARQAALAEQLSRHNSNAIFVVESALLFETEHAGPGGWRTRFDRIVLVTASDEHKIQRFIARAGQLGGTPEEREQDARARLARQLPDAEKAAMVDFVLANDGSLDELRDQVDRLWQQLSTASSPDQTGSR